MGCSPWDLQESDTTERLHFHFSLSCIGEGNGNPLQCSWLENPRDGGAWWAAVYGVTQSRTRLKRLSSSSSTLFLLSQFKRTQQAGRKRNQTEDFQLLPTKQSLLWEGGKSFHLLRFSFSSANWGPNAFCPELPRGCREGTAAVTPQAFLILIPLH